MPKTLDQRIAATKYAKVFCRISSEFSYYYQNTPKKTRAYVGGTQHRLTLLTNTQVFACEMWQNLSECVRNALQSEAFR